MQVELIDKKINQWIDKNREVIVKNIGKPYFYTEDDVSSFISMFPFDMDMDFVAYRLFTILSTFSFVTIVKKRKGKKCLEKEVKKAALFSTLNGYARQTYVEDLVGSFPMDECEKVLKE